MARDDDALQFQSAVTYLRLFTDDRAENKPVLQPLSSILRPLICPTRLGKNLFASDGGRFFRLLVGLSA